MTKINFDKKEGVGTRWVILQESVRAPSQDLQIPTGQKIGNTNNGL